MRVLDLFSGIGGFSLGFERARLKTVAFCEFDKKCQRVLKKHWPDTPIFDDIKSLKGSELRKLKVDIVCGGFPCQDISCAGKQAGLDGDKSSLWFEMARIIKEVKPRYAVIENVAHLRNLGLAQVLKNLWQIGYDAEWHIIPASAVGAVHRRERLWIVAYPAHKRCKRLWPEGIEIPLKRLAETQIIRSLDRQWKIEPDVRRTDDGLSPQVDRLKQLGNAVVPQITEIIGRELVRHKRRKPRQ